MPAQTSPGSRTTSNSTSSSDVHIASSNATVNAFLGTRKPKPSWMDGGVTGATPRPLAPRQPPPQAISKQPVQTHTVLPSPAPSDEPSPAVSNALDSPNPPPASLTEKQAMGSSGTSGSAGAPVTEARFVHDLTVAAPTPNGQELFRSGYSGVPLASNGHLQSPSIISPQFTAASQPGAVLASPQVSTVQSTLPTTSANNPTFGAAQTRSIQSPRIPEVPSVTGNGRPHQVKRRRTDPAQPRKIKYSGFMPAIDYYIQSCGGEKAFSTDIERPRMQLIREACTREDGFFLALHQLFCMWSNSPTQIHQLLPISPEIINSAFAIVETVLKKNQLVTGSHRDWFARFPAELSTLLQSPATIYASSVEQVSNFLFNLTEHFNTLTEKSLRRRYPYLVDELLFYLGCYSPVLQIIFFTASRRRLGVLDSPLGLQIETAFRSDQQGHVDPATGLQVLTPIGSRGEIERRNSKLIEFYKLIVAQAQAQAQANSQLQPSSTPVSASLVVNSPRPSNLLRRSVSSNVSIAPQPGSQPGTTNQGPYSPSTSFSPTFGVLVTPGQSQTQPNSPMMASPPPTGGQGVCVQMSPQFMLPSNNQIAQSQASSYAPSEEQRIRYRLQHQQQHQQQQFSQHPLHQNAGHPGMQLQHQQPLQQPQFAQYQQLYAQAQAQHMNQSNTFGQANFMNTPPAQQQTHHHQLQVQVPQHGVGLPSLLIPQSGNMSPGSAVNNGISPGARQSSRAMQQSMRQNASHRHMPNQANNLLLPAKGYSIPRPEIPYEPNEKKAIMMSLHQAHVRSPKRVMKMAGTERYYQAAKSFPVAPTFLAPNSSIHQFSFVVTEDQYAATSRGVKKDGNLLPVIEHFNGSLRWRIRCCKAPTMDERLTEEQWSALDMSWPPNIFMKFNGRPLDIRRQSHNGKDLPIELTDMVSLGTNVLQVVLPDIKRERSNRRFLAVEMLETLSHSNVVAMVWERGLVPESKTLEIIKKRLGGSAEDDEVSVLDPELSIGLADPFSAVIFKIPVRGAECTHMECFDLENWLNTRPSKSTVKCHHQYIQCDCPTLPEPSNPDKWRCPICLQDARPYSLRIDGFLLGVRSQLEKQDKLRTKSLKVNADGRWEVVLEENDDSDNSDDDSGPPVKKRSAPPIFKKPSVSSTAKRQDVEVIEIDDD